MTDKEYNRLVELRNKCYQDRRDRETDINYFTGFNDGYEKGKESLEENEELKTKVGLFIECDDVHLRKIADLEKENKILRIHQTNAVLEGLEMEVLKNSHRDRANNLQDQLTKAKELLKDFVALDKDYDWNLQLAYDAERFLKELDNDKEKKA